MNPNCSDQDLLSSHAAGESGAFGELVRRHVGWVHAVARRRVGDAHLADDVTQAVFVVLAQKAARLREGTVLSAWLFHVTRLAAGRALRDDARRRRRETEATRMRLASNPQQIAPPIADPDAPDWDRIRPMLDDSVAALRTADRSAVLLRFYQQRSFAQIGAAIGASEDAARKRVNRALEQLRKLLGRRGIKAPAAGLAGLLWIHSGNANAGTVASASAATEVLIQSIQSAVANAATGNTISLAKGTITMMTLNKWRWIAAAALIAVISGLGIVSLQRAAAQARGFKAPIEAVLPFVALAHPDKPEAKPGDAAQTHDAHQHNTVIPILAVADLQKSLDYYTNKLGFQTQWIHGGMFASIERGGMQIFLAQDAGQGQPGMWLYLSVANADTFYEDLLKRGAEVLSEPEDKEWMMREFLVKDPDGHHLRIGSSLAPPPDGHKPKD